MSRYSDEHDPTEEVLKKITREKIPPDFGPRRCSNLGCQTRYWTTDNKPNCPVCGELGSDEPYLAEKRKK